MRRTGSVLCRIALWECFGTLNLASITKFRAMLGRDSYPETVPSCNLIQHGPSLRLEFKMADSEFFRTYIDSPRLKYLISNITPNP